MCGEGLGKRLSPTLNPDCMFVPEPKHIGYFNHRVVTMVTKATVVEWFILVEEQFVQEHSRDNYHISIILQTLNH